ncbi:MAG: DUF1254 domain-containing protein [Bauldia sp.]|nr:DUF1254 domain-containing protein [Bauldia sp.]
MKRTILFAALLAPVTASAEDVTVDNFVRAESDYNIRANLKAVGADVGQLVHQRDPVTAENQTVIRSNQDTLYSSVILDLSEPVIVTLPEIGGRYMSMHVVNQDHYMFVETKPGTYDLTEDSVGTRFAQVIFRTFTDPGDPEDLESAHAAQDAIAIAGGGAGPFNAPDWDEKALAAGRKALNDFAVLGFNSAYAFGRKEETRPIDHLIGAAAGWGGLPRTAATYVITSVDGNDGTTPYTLTAKDVPVGEFWSVTVYNANGYLEANDRGVNSYNNVTAEPNADGSITINFGGCDDGRINCIPITTGWNYTVRMYEPGPEILDGSWTFPVPEPAG